MAKHGTNSRPQIENSARREPALLPRGELREFTNEQCEKFFARDKSLDGFDGTILEQRLRERIAYGQKRIVTEEAYVCLYIESAIEKEASPIIKGWLKALQVRVVRSFDVVNAAASDPTQFNTSILSGLAALDAALVGSPKQWFERRQEIEERIEQEAEDVIARALQLEVSELQAEASEYSDEGLRGFYQSIIDQLIKTIPANLKAETVIDKPAQTERIALPAIGNGLLDQVIRAAQMECSDPFLSAEVFLRLRAMAEVRTRPFIGVTSEGLQWMDGNDSPQYLSKRNLSERLKRQKVRALAREMSR